MHSATNRCLLDQLLTSELEDREPPEIKQPKWREDKWVSGRGDAMGLATVNAVILGERPEGSSYLRGHLEQQGCHCVFARSLDEAFAEYEPHAIDLLLSTKPLPKAEELQQFLGGASCTVYFCFRVEDGCWWLPLLSRGQKCLGAPAFRPSEFVGELDRLVKDIQHGARIEPEPAAHLVAGVSA
jgi:hypothetical protein